MNNIKLIVSEVDGVLTDGTIPIDELGNVPYKSFYSEDFEVINEIKKDITVVFLSSDNSISYHLFRRKNIPFFWAKRDKYSALLDILRRYNVSAEEVVYIGSKFSDIKCATTIPNSFCPSNSNIKLRNTCTVLNAEAGCGVITDFFLTYLRK